MHANIAGAVDWRLKAHGFLASGGKRMAFGGGGVAPSGV